MTGFQFASSVRRTYRLVSFSALLAGMSAVGSLTHAQVLRKDDWAAPVVQSSNLFRMTPMLYRSAQLKYGDVALLKSLGIKTVVSLRAFHSDRKLLTESGIGMKQVRIYTWHIRDQEVIDALRAIRDAERDGPVLLHCQHGADRTGLISAMYRMAYEGWDKERAIDELMHGGYGYHAMWKNIPSYLRTVDVERIRQAVDQ
jgi:protein tyrosine/serine phosphatase